MQIFSLVLIKVASKYEQPLILYADMSVSKNTKCHFRIHEEINKKNSSCINLSKKVNK